MVCGCPTLQDVPFRNGFNKNLTMKTWKKQTSFWHCNGRSWKVRENIDTRNVRFWNADHHIERTWKRYTREDFLAASWSNFTSPPSDATQPNTKLAMKIGHVGGVLCLNRNPCQRHIISRIEPMSQMTNPLGDRWFKLWQWNFVSLEILSDMEDSKRRDSLYTMHR